MPTSMNLPAGFTYHLLYVLLLPTFFICFCSVYDPFAVKDLYSVGGKTFFFHFLMLTSIMMGVMVITRVIFSLLYKVLTMQLWHYLLWCFGEVIVISFFHALYTTLFFGHELPYFMALPICFKICSLVLIYPYALLIMARELTNKDQMLVMKDSLSENSLVKFYDEHKRLKLTIDPSALLYISAEANYVKIHYLENDKVREFLLRNSMKRLEETVSKHGLVRCHRSYCVNPKHIKVLRRNKDGIIIAEMIEDGLRKIPVSRQYYEYLSELL